MKLFKQYLLLLSLVFIGMASYGQNESDFKEKQDSVLEEFAKVKPWYVFGNDKYTLVPLALMAMDVSYYNQDANSKIQVGDQDLKYEPGQIRAVRFGAVGTFKLKKTWRYVFSVAYKAFNQGFNTDSAIDFTIYDLRIDIPTSFGYLAIGKMKEPISMQRNASLIYLGGFERGMNLDGLLPSRSTGLMYYNNFYKKQIYFAAGAFRMFSPPLDITWKSGNTVGVSRLAYNPIYGHGKNQDVHLGIGYRYSNFNRGGNLRQYPEAYFTSKFIETGPLQGDNLQSLNYEIAYRYKNLLITSEYTTAKISNDSLLNPEFNGFFVQADYCLTGEQRTYKTNNATFSAFRPTRNVQEGGTGAIELTFRYSMLNANSGLVTGGNMSRISGFVNWYPTVLTKLQLGYGYVWLDRFNLIGRTHILQIRFAVLIG